MNILIVTTEFPSVSQTFIADHIASMVHRGHDLTVVSLARRPGVVQDDLKASVTVRYVRDPATLGLFVSGLATGRLRLKWLLRHLSKLWGRNIGQTLKQIAVDTALSAPAVRNMDVVHVHFGPLARLVAQARRAGIFTSPLIATFHGYDATQIIRRMPVGYYRILFEEAALLHSVSERIQGKLEGAGASPEQIRVRRVGLPRGLSRDVGNRHPTPEIAGEGRDAPDGAPLRIVSVGRFVEKKGLEYAISSLHLLAALRPDLHFRYDIIGDGILNDRLRALASSGSAAEHIHFAGPQPRSMVLDTITAADILLQPSVTASTGDEEGIPVVIMEAMKLGTTVLATEHAGIPELVEHRVSGCLVPERDAYAIFQALTELAEDATLRKNCAARALPRVTELHDASKIALELEEDYRNVMDVAATGAVIS